MKLTADLHLVPRLKVSGARPAFPHMPLWCSQRLSIYNTKNIKYKNNKRHLTKTLESHGGGGGG
jgi:hypothetical protein